jgi:hypothetical protein
MKYVYLYKITLKKKRKKPLYYFGIRSCQCLPEDDPYMGSPTTYADLWKDESYVKTKEILKFGEYDTWFEKFRDEEVDLIKEGWNQFGVYGKNKKGLCLNANAGKSIHPFFFTGDKNPMKRPEITAKRSGENHHMKRPEVRAKISGENNPMKRPEVRAKQKEIMKRPEVKAKFSGDNNPMKRPEIRAKHKEAIKRNKLLRKLQNATGSLESFFT